MIPARRAARAVFAAASAALLLLASAPAAAPFPVSGRDTVLPAGSELGEDALDVPREIFRSEAMGGTKSYLVRLGDMAFNAPSLLGGPARRAGISCGTCHVNGSGNARLYIPGLSTRPGTFDTTGDLFNPPADNGVLDAVTPPSLRGARVLGPYGHDGRFASLRDFVRNVIVSEFAGPEPSPAILDALVTYIDEIDFLPNPRLAAGGVLAPGASAAEQRGAALFRKPFPHQPALSCAACHVPSAAFVDHRQHDIGSGGLFKTPTLINANVNGPYFHDGRFDTYAQVVAYFDHAYDLGLSPQDRQDLVAYLTAVGDGVRAYERDGADLHLAEIDEFASVLATAIPAGDTAVVALTVDTVGGELRELTEEFPDRRDPTVTGGKDERSLARAALKDRVLDLRRIGAAVAAGKLDEAKADYELYRKEMAAAVPQALHAAEPWSLFNPAIHDAHYGALRQMLQADKSPH
jgi:cytochrome c peroxidase